jgi:hypothetical protein
MKRLLCIWFPLWLLFGAVPSRSADAETKRLDLSGVVQNKSGQPIADASVFIYTAGPKLGVGFL